MELEINKQPQTVIPLSTFREQWALPDDFTVAYFEPKDLTGLGRMHGSGRALAEIKQRVLEAVPPSVAATALVDQVGTLTAIFRHELEAINSQIGLRPVEVDFAVAGFQDLLQAIAFRLIELLYTHRHNLDQVRHGFDFSIVYQNWLNDSMRVSATTHTYQAGANRFEVRIIYNAFGRVGLEVDTPDGRRRIVTDPALACPASSYMQTLCEQTAQAFCRALLATE